MSFVARLAAVSLCFSSGLARAQDDAVQNNVVKDIVEMPLPAFQASALTSDEPVQDLLLEPDGTVWMLGRTSIWRWAAPTKTLKRLRLGKTEIAAQDALTHLGSDGVSVFAAGSGALYQAQWAEGRVFRYPLKPKAPVFGFAGFADDFWLVQAASLFHFDRYGRKLEPRGARPKLLADDLALYDAQAKTLWIARKTTLFRQTLGTPELKATLKASHPLLGIAQGDGELILHTANAVLRVGRDGKLKTSIPVEGRRKLVAMDVTPETHAYVFADELLEIYDVKTRNVRRFRLPLGGVSQISALRLKGAFVTMLADGRPRAFRTDGY